MSELKPCPFCGWQPKVVYQDVEPQEDRWYRGKHELFVLCGCGACLFDEDFHEGFDSEELAMKAWNRRAPDPDLLSLLREARDLLLNPCPEWTHRAIDTSARIDAALKETE